MKKTHLPLTLMAFVLATVLMGACSRGVQTPANNVAESDSLLARLTGDSTLYGLACDGCTDTILVFLRDVEADPDTFNILAATKGHRIFGRPKVGADVAIVRSPKDSTVADIVICMNDLLGSWCYEVMPTLRRRADQPDLTERQLLALMPDSLREVLMVPREYGFTIKAENVVYPIGLSYASASEMTDEESPVEYPSVKFYREWHLYNGGLILTSMRRDSTGQMQVMTQDTTSFVFLSRDSLALRFRNGVKGYYRKE